MRVFYQTSLLMLLLATLTIAGCQEFEGHEGVVTLISANSMTKSESNAAQSPEPLVSTVQVKEPYQGGVFYATSRKDKIGRFPCSNCHNGKTSQIANAREMAHGDIVLSHGAVTHPDACDTCHDMEERDFLAGEMNQKIDFDHSYQKCAQCHFQQEKDWVGGAHGKRVQYWQGVRVVANCTSCHNPHAPAFAKRWPATYSPLDPVISEQLSSDDPF